MLTMNQTRPMLGFSGTPGGDGVVLFSGGMDCVCLGILAKRQGLDLTPVYLSHRANVGNVTKKELVVARQLAKPGTGNDLIVFKPPSKRQADWYGPNVLATSQLPVSKARKPYRNRVFLEVLSTYGLGDKAILVGVFGDHDMSSQVARSGRGPDVTRAGLSAHLKKSGGTGQIIIASDYTGTRGDTNGKIALLKAVGQNSPDAQLIGRSESCLMYFNTHCGNCWSCVDRAQAFMDAWGADPTSYRSQTTAWKIARGRGADRE